MERVLGPVLDSLLPNGPDPRPAMRLMEVAGLLAAALIPAFIVYTQLAGRFPSQVQYGTALYLGLVAIFCLKPAFVGADGRRTALDVAFNLVLIAGATFAYVYFTDQYDDIAANREGLPNRMDLWCYAVGSVVVIFGAHRAEGWLLTGVVLVAVVYLLFGHVMPGILEHRPFRLSRVLEISYGYRGIFGVALGAVVDIVLVFVILGVALRLTGAGEFFNDLALILTRGRRSGPAQCAIIASALFGSINGSAPANVASTGVLTIPMMRRAGYSGRFAGGVESTASCVGQIMPPVMGVGAFIMSDVTGIPYVTIMFAALVPALLYLFSLSVTVGLEAGRLDLRPLEDAPPVWDRRMFSRAALLLIGFGTLLTMLFSGFPATYSGLIATGVILVLAMILPETRLDLTGWLRLVVDSGRDGLSVLVSCAAIGIVIAAITSTGLGIKLNQEITALGDSNLLAALILAAICSIVLGMGLPTAASYLMVIFVAGPAIMDLGVSQLRHPSVRLLLRRPVGDHAAGGAGRLRRRRHRQGKPHTPCPERAAARLGGVHPAHRLDLSPRDRDRHAGHGPRGGDDLRALPSRGDRGAGGVARGLPVRAADLGRAGDPARGGGSDPDADIPDDTCWDRGDPRHRGPRIPETTPCRTGLRA
jgi:TRAP transporter 4TM/12TM fusion protein